MAKEAPRVPMFDEYFRHMESQILLLKRKSHLLFRQASPLLKYVVKRDSKVPESRITGEGSTKILLSCPCV